MHSAAFWNTEHLISVEAAGKRKNGRRKQRFAKLMKRSEKSNENPGVELNWVALREQMNNRLDLADPSSPAVQKLVSTLRALNLDLAGFFPPVLRISESPAVAEELLLQLRLLQSTIQIKLDQFDRT